MGRICPSKIVIEMSKNGSEVTSIFAFFHLFSFFFHLFPFSSLFHFFFFASFKILGGGEFPLKIWRGHVFPLPPPLNTPPRKVIGSTRETLFLSKNNTKFSILDKVLLYIFQDGFIFRASTYWNNLPTDQQKHWKVKVKIMD